MTGSGAEIKNGYIQRSNALPIFREPQKFLNWFHDQKPEFIHANNILATPRRASLAQL
jgi:hypothetical protein